MSSDGGSNRKFANLWSLPNVVNIAFMYVRYSQPQPDYVLGSLLPVYRQDAVEILVKTDGPLPVRALSPTLIIGEIPVETCQLHADNLHRFIAYNYASLQPNVPIYLGWPQFPDLKKDTGFVYNPPAGTPA